MPSRPRSGSSNTGLAPWARCRRQTCRQRTPSINAAFRMCRLIFQSRLPVHDDIEGRRLVLAGVGDQRNACHRATRQRGCRWCSRDCTAHRRARPAPRFEGALHAAARHQRLTEKKRAPCRPGSSAARSAAARDHHFPSTRSETLDVNLESTGLVGPVRDEAAVRENAPAAVFRSDKMGTGFRSPHHIATTHKSLSARCGLEARKITHRPSSTIVRVCLAVPGEKEASPLRSIAALSCGASTHRASRKHDPAPSGDHTVALLASGPNVTRVRAPLTRSRSQMSFAPRPPLMCLGHSQLAASSVSRRYTSERLASLSPRVPFLFCRTMSESFGGAAAALVARTPFSDADTAPRRPPRSSAPPVTFTVFKSKAGALRPAALDPEQVRRPRREQPCLAFPP